MEYNACDVYHVTSLVMSALVTRQARARTNAWYSEGAGDVLASVSSMHESS